MPESLIIFLGGGLGSVCRYLMSKIITENLETTFPWGTLTVNILGSFLIGIFLGLIAKHELHGAWKYLLVTGFCGGFTTFSTFAHDNYSLLRGQKYLESFAYTGFSLFWGFAATFLGLWLVKMSNN